MNVPFDCIKFCSFTIVTYVNKVCDFFSLHNIKPQAVLNAGIILLERIKININNNNKSCNKRKIMSGERR